MQTVPAAERIDLNDTEQVLDQADPARAAHPRTTAARALSVAANASRLPRARRWRNEPDALSFSTASESKAPSSRRNERIIPQPRLHRLDAIQKPLKMTKRCRNLRPSLRQILRHEREVAK